MHRPPAVSWDVGPARWRGRVLTALALCATLDWTGFWVLQGWSTSSFFLLLLVFASVLLAGLSNRNTPVGQLRWDGEQWHWSGVDHDTVRVVACVLDLQRMLLLHIRCEQGACHWLWLEAAAQPTRWRAMRRAVVAATPLKGSETGSTQQA